MQLPKYKKQWSKERVNFGYSDDLKNVYLVFEEYNPILHHGEWKTTRLLQWQKELYPCNDMYFFEIFKYLRKYQIWKTERAMGTGGIKEIKSEIKTHLIKKHAKQLHGGNKLSMLAHYGRFLDYCFETLDLRAKITLVIQKKIGYKYYENITYY